MGPLTIELSKDERRLLIDEVKKYFLEQDEETLGDMRAGFILDFFVERIGPTVYNRAISDAVSSLQNKLIDLEGELYEQPPRERKPKKS